MTTKQASWARGAALRGLVALPLVAGLVTAGWLLADRSPEPAAVPVPPPVVRDAVSGPSVLEVSAPVKAQEPGQGASGQGGKSPLQQWAEQLAGPLDIPASALIGYANGELALRGEDPSCHLSWVTLAGVGAAASDHGRGGGNLLGLTAAQTKKFGSDAPAAAGRALCAGDTDLGAGPGWWKAIAAYHPGSDTELFRQRVLGMAQLYATLSLDPASASSPRVRATRFALGQLGLPYVWGGNGPDAGAAGFDCSGLTKASYDSAGVALPRTADSQFRALPPVPAAQEPRLGDLVFYGSPATRIHHVGLYLGNGLMINAPTEGQAIQIHTYHSKGDDYAGAGRPA
ncbi:C40 family peptidase [Amycolatopsis sp. CA-126428]|uniref:C40 family peptidase n=1 Tax=Amycolatopsis sp. CA-126428 TaxID=2073158 RepID=UPI000CD07448|nr:C40 family peptidase [Amycolatopsis sp. CA-126428]